MCLELSARGGSITQSPERIGSFAALEGFMQKKSHLQSDCEASVCIFFNLI